MSSFMPKCDRPVAASPSPSQEDSGFSTDQRGAARPQHKQMGPGLAPPAGGPVLSEVTSK